MAPAGRMEWLPGFGCFFQFSRALLQVRKDLSSTFLENEWDAALRKTLKECKEECFVDKDNLDVACSGLVFQITFLDLLWIRLFGIASGPSPWKALRNNLDPRALCDEGTDTWVRSSDIPDTRSAADKEIADFIEHTTRRKGAPWHSSLVPAQMDRILKEWHPTAAADAKAPIRPQKRDLEVKEEKVSPKRQKSEGNHDVYCDTPGNL